MQPKQRFIDTQRVIKRVNTKTHDKKKTNTTITVNTNVTNIDTMSVTNVTNVVVNTHKIIYNVNNTKELTNPLLCDDIWKFIMEVSCNLSPEFTYLRTVNKFSLHVIDKYLSSKGYPISEKHILDIPKCALCNRYGLLTQNKTCIYAFHNSRICALGCKHVYCKNRSCYAFGVANVYYDTYFPDDKQCQECHKNTLAVHVYGDDVDYCYTWSLGTIKYDVYSCVIQGDYYDSPKLNACDDCRKRFSMCDFSSEDY